MEFDKAWVDVSFDFHKPFCVYTLPPLTLNPGSIPKNKSAKVIQILLYSSYQLTYYLLKHYKNIIYQKKYIIYLFIYYGVYVILIMFIDTWVCKLLEINER